MSAKFLSFCIILITISVPGFCNDEQTIIFRNTPIPVNPSDRPLISGVDFDAMLRELIPQFDGYTSRKRTHSNYMLRARWGISYPPGINPFDPESMNSLENPERYQNSIDISFGVFASHREAIVKGLKQFDNMASAIPPTVICSEGYVSVYSRLIVRDNVYFLLRTKGNDVETSINPEKIDRMLLEGGPGVYKNNEPLRPVLKNNGVLQESLIAIESQGNLPLFFDVPGGLDVFVHAYAIPETRTNDMRLKVYWDDDSCAVYVKGDIGIQGKICINSASEFGVFAETISIPFEIVEPGEGSAWTMSPKDSRVQSFTDYR